MGVQFAHGAAYTAHADISLNGKPLVTGFPVTPGVFNEAMRGSKLVLMYGDQLTLAVSEETSAVYISVLEGVT